MLNLFEISAAVGGVGVVLIGLSKLCGGILSDFVKENIRGGTERDIESHKNRLASRRIQADEFLKSQYDVYINLWKSLQGLQFVVDALWQKANGENIVALAEQLRYMKSQIRDWSLFFEGTHLEELNRLLEILETFKAGKMNLVEIRSKEDIPRFFPHEIERQIGENRDYKEKFEQILEEMRVSFQRRLSRIE